MEILKFTLSGKGANFTRPHFNSIISSYSHIHKVPILGILGAIIGIDKDLEPIGLPTFYKELMDLEISIVPYKKSFFRKTDTIIQSTGFCNDGDNYVVRYDTLLNPMWDIYIKNKNNPHYEDIKNRLFNKEAVYTPYLGRNHWFANINNVSILEGKVVTNVEGIDSLFSKDDITTEVNDDFMIRRVYFKEYMPVGLDDKLYQYKEKELVFTNDIVTDNKVDLIEADDRILYFI